MGSNPTHGVNSVRLLNCFYCSLQSFWRLTNITLALLSYSMSRENLQFIAYELQRQNFVVKQPRPNDGRVLDNVGVISPADGGATPSRVLNLKVTNSDDYNDPDTSSGRWVEIRHENGSNRSEKYTIHVSDNGISGSPKKVGSISVDDFGQDKAREKTVRKVADVFR